MIRVIGFLICALLLNTAATAQTLYQVELIAFARSGSDAENEENWDRKLTLRYPQRSVPLQPGGDASAAFQPLGNDAMQLTREADALASRRNIRVLLHTAWRQPADPPDQAAAAIIAGGKSFGHRELEGSFTLSAERFLRADVNLWLSRFSTEVSMLSLPLPPGSTPPLQSEATAYFPAQTVLLQEQRRVRSGELHYFDHPKLGLIVLVTPVAAAP